VNHFQRFKIDAMLRKSILFLFLLMTGAGLIAQQQVTGLVTDSSNEPIPGASILEKGTMNGTITEVNGRYTIEVNEGATLVFSFIGFESLEIPIDGRSSIDVTLQEAITGLDEVVVVGYGVQKKKLITGATSQVKGDILENRNSTDPLQALQGQAAGINITSTSGQPGEDMKVNIRGLGTIGNSGPLFIVDGVQTGGIGYLNPSDIESIDVLKDAASAAIYGSRAANGVVLITTKQGKKGTTRVSFDGYYGLQSRAKEIEMLNSQQYGMIMNEQHINSGGSPSNLPFNLNDLPAYTESGPADTDWLGEMFVDNAVTQNYSLNVSGGNDMGVYSLGLSYTGQEGIVGGKDNSFYERYNGRFNSEKELFEGNVRIGQHLTFAYTNNNGISVGNQYSNTLRGAFNVSPLHPMYDDNGEFFNAASSTIVDQHGNTYWNSLEGHPYASMVLGNQNTNNDQKLLGDVYAEIDVLEDLTFKTTFGIDYYANERRTYTPIYELSDYAFSDYSEASQRMGKGLTYNFDNILTYNKRFGLHNVEGMVGISSRQYNGSWMYSSNADVAFDDLDHAYINNTTNQEWAKLSLQGAPEAEDKLLSYFGRVQYNYDETYMFNVVFRADGSSKFAEGNRWGYFPSLSAGWVMSNESFMEDLSFLNFFKLRASWGQNGNQNISSFQYMAPIKFTQATYAFGDTEGENTNGSYPSRLSNEDLKWETSEQLNIGFDANLLNNHLTVNFDWYEKTTKDWLVIAPVLATAGTDAPFINGGSVINSGLELVLGYNNNLGDFRYSVNLNGAYNQNEVQEIPTEDGIIHGAGNTLFSNSPEFYRAESGHPIGYFWGYETDGVFQNTGEVQDHTNPDGTIIQPKAKPGDVRFVDQDNDGKLNDDDKVELGDPNPDFVYGLSVNLNYRAFDFYLNGNGVAGNQIVQSYRGHTDKYANYTTAILDRWNGEGTSNRIPRVTNSNVNYNQFSDLFIQDGDYFRISNVTLGFDVAKVMEMGYFSKFRVYASVQNLYTFTSYNGMDPEVGYGLDNGETDNFSSGIDLGYYPRPRTILFGINVNF
jgi:TonB-linked SusC/RagA family outer membrane protein